MSNLYKKDLGLGIGTIVLGVCAMIYFLGIPSGPSFYPKMICTAILILGVFITLSAWKEMRKNAPAQEEKKSSREISYKTVAIIVAYMIIYYVAFQIIGYTIPTFLMITATSVTLGYKRWKVLIPTALGVSVGLYLAFTQIFAIRFPGIFF